MKICIPLNPLLTYATNGKTLPLHGRHNHNPPLFPLPFSTLADISTSPVSTFLSKTSWRRIEMHIDSYIPVKKEVGETNFDKLNRPPPYLKSISIYCRRLPPHLWISCTWKLPPAFVYAYRQPISSPSLLIHGSETKFVYHRSTFKTIFETKSMESSGKPFLKPL